jgi:hypothetical protein
MDTPEPAPNPQPATDFEKASSEAPPSLLSEFLDFLRYNKKWWMLPILLCLLLLGVLVLLSTTSVAPFIYTMF